MNEKKNKQRIWDDLLDFIRSWTNTASEKAGEFTRTAATKAEEWSKVGRLKVDIYQLQREQSRMLTDLGRIAFDILEGKDKTVLGAHEGALDLQKRITAIKGEIRRKEQEIEEAAQAEDTAAKEQASPKAKPAEGTQTKTASEKKQAAPKPAASKPAQKKSLGKASKAAPKKAPSTSTKKSTTGAKKKAPATTSKSTPKKTTGGGASKSK